MTGEVAFQTDGLPSSVRYLIIKWLIRDNEQVEREDLFLREQGKVHLFWQKAPRN